MKKEEPDEEVEVTDGGQAVSDGGQPAADAGRKPKWASLIFGGDMLQSRAVLKQTKLVLLVILYALVLVLCRYRVEGLTKEKMAEQDRADYLRESRIELQKRYQEQVKISQIAELLDSTGVGITAGPPYEI